MAINLTQKFCFQNDDIGSIEQMLRAALPVIMPMNKKCDFLQLYINFTKESSSWESGRRYLGSSLSVLPIANKWCVIDGNGMYHGSQVAKVLKEFNTQDAACDFVCDRDSKNWSKPERLWVCTIGNYVSDMNKDCTKYSNYEDCIADAIHHLESAKASRADELDEKCEDKWANGDGSHGIGFDVRSNYSVFRSLHLSLTHFYYGK